MPTPTTRIVENQPPIHRTGQCQWCDLYRSTGTPFRGHCPEQDIKAEDVTLPDPLDGFGSDNPGPPQRHADAEVESLKRNWRSDPCWRLASTEGFEAHADELEAYEDAYWVEARLALERKEQTDRESQPAYWLKELVTEVRTLNANLASIDSRLDGISQLIGLAGRI